MFDNSVKRIGFCCKYLEEDQTQKPKILKEKQAQEEALELARKQAEETLRQKQEKIQLEKQQQEELLAKQKAEEQRLIEEQKELLAKQKEAAGKVGESGALSG